MGWGRDEGWWHQDFRNQLGPGLPGEGLGLFPFYPVFDGVFLGRKLFLHPCRTGWICDPEGRQVMGAWQGSAELSPFGVEFSVVRISSGDQSRVCKSGCHA